MAPGPKVAAGPGGKLGAHRGQRARGSNGAFGGRGRAGREVVGGETGTCFLFKVHQEAPGDPDHLLRSAPLTSPAPGLPPTSYPWEVHPRHTHSSLPTDKPRLLSTDGSLPTHQLWSPLLSPVGPIRALCPGNTDNEGNSEDKASPCGISPWYFFASTFYH